MFSISDKMPLDFSKVLPSIYRFVIITVKFRLCYNKYDNAKKIINTSIKKHPALMK